VPHIVLVDTHGKVVYIGHPMAIDLEASINTLLLEQKIKNSA